MAKVNWRSDRDGVWSDGRNWLSGVPTAADDAVIRGTDFTVTLFNDQQVRSVLVSGESVVLDQTTGGYLIIPRFGDFGNGIGLRVEDGATVNLRNNNLDLAANVVVENSTITFGRDAGAGTGFLQHLGGLMDFQGSTRIANQSVFVSSSDAQSAAVRIATGEVVTFANTFGIGDAVINDEDHAGTIVVEGLLYVGGTAGSSRLAAGTLRLADTALAQIDQIGFRVDEGATVDLGGGRMVVGAFDNGGLITNTASKAGTFVVAEGGISRFGAYDLGLMSGNVILSAASRSGQRDFFDVGGRFNLTGNGGIALDNVDLMLSGVLSLAREATVTLNAASLALNERAVVNGGIAMTGSSQLVLLDDVRIGGAITMDDSSFIAPVAGDTVVTGRVTGGDVNLNGGAITFTNKVQLDEVILLGNGTVQFDRVDATTARFITVQFGTMLLNDDGRMVTDLDILGGSVGTIAVASGRTVELAGEWTTSNTINYGKLTLNDAMNDGTIVWNQTTRLSDRESIFANRELDLAGGTMRIARAAAADGLSRFGTVTLAEGATLDLAGLGATLRGLNGAGDILAGTNRTTLQLYGAYYGGTITSTDLTLRISAGFNSLSAASFLTADQQVARTVIDAGATLVLGNGGTSGSVSGTIRVDGLLQVDRSDTLTLSQSIAGTGAFEQFGTGTTILSARNAHSGGTIVSGGTLRAATNGALGRGEVEITGGTLEVATAAPLGSQVLDMSGGALFYTTSAALRGDLTVSDGSTATISAAAGAALRLEADVTLGGISLELNTVADAGRILLAPTAFTRADNYNLIVAGGIVSIGSAAAVEMIGEPGFLAVRSAGTLDFNGFSATLDNLNNAGRLVNTGAAITVTFDNAAITSSGVILGAITVVAQADVDLSGNNRFTELVVDGAHTATLGGFNSQAIDLEGTGARLIVADGARLTGILSDFGTDDTIEFDGLDFGAGARVSYIEVAAGDAGVLRVTDGTDTVSIRLTGDYDAANFALGNDGDGHIRVAFVDTSPALAALTPADHMAFAF